MALNQNIFVTYLIVLIWGYLAIWFWDKRFSLENKYPRAMMALKLAVTIALAALGTHFAPR